MSDSLVRVENVSKKFCKSLKHSMLYGARNIAKSIVGIPPSTDELEPHEFWALEDVSFELKRGECLGLIGPNGSGKSTMLKVLNGIISPDRGRVEIEGRVGALIEVSAGFHPVLTGRENIYVNGAILGFSKKEIDRKFDDIVEFSGIGDFIDTPVKHYSSGMYVRLGFAIAAQMEPDVLLIDEILTVGDIGFKARCFNAIEKISKNSAVIFVSHQMPQVARICSDVCVLEKGKIIYQGKNVAQGINEYYNRFPLATQIMTGSGKAELRAISLESGTRKDIETVHHSEELIVHLSVSISRDIEKPVIGIAFMTQELQLIAQCFSSFNNVEILNDSEIIRVKVRIPSILFSPGIYFINLSFLDNHRKEVLLWCCAAKKIQVLGECIASAPLQLLGEWTVY